MHHKYRIIAGCEKQHALLLYSGDNPIVAAIVYRSSVRASAFDPKSDIALQDVSFYADGKLLEMYQPLRRGL